jgi:hypothetical protein
LKLRLVFAMAVCGLLAGCGGNGAVRTVVEDANPAKRAAAAAKLAHPSASQKKATVEALAAATADADAKVRENAVASLSKISGDEARQALLDVVRGRQYSRLALKQYKLADAKAPHQPDILEGMARAQQDLGLYADAEKTYDQLAKDAGAMPGPQGQRPLQQVQQGYTMLKMAYQKTGDSAGVDRVTKSAEKVAEKLKAAGPPQGGMGGMGGMDMGDMGDMGGMMGDFGQGGMPIQIPHSP